MKISLSVVDGEIHIRTIKYYFSFIRLSRSLGEKKMEHLHGSFCSGLFLNREHSFLLPPDNELICIYVFI